MDDFVTELNNHLITVYQTALKIREMIELCEFYANMSNSKRNAIPAKMLKNAHCQEDFGVLDLIDQAQKNDKFFFANIAVKLKCLLGRLCTADPPQAPDLERNKRKKVKKMVERVIDGGDLDLVLSYENDEECLLNESMLEDQETFRHQIENLGYAFIHVMREVILTDDEDQEEGEIVTYAEEEDDIVTDDDDEDD
uniref:Uncharacterized protein n=1 Tax=Oryza sativa subsp. japonica TaxID=39947 RepID=Q2R0N9_ORYSJ|nr:hypothetical protein LOC_Os11g41940 [Oryza sativa Japonica Group]